MRLFFLSLAALLVTALGHGADLCVPVGWCTQNGGTTGGGTAAAVTVTTLANLQTQAAGTVARVIYVQGTLGAGVGTRVVVGSNKTIYGLPGATLVGGFDIKDASNVILRNMRVQGPGAIDVDGVDCVTIQRSTNVWVDHCDIWDGQDGNLDIVNGSNYICVTWTKFHYTSASVEHQFCNLLGNSDSSTEDPGKVKVTLLGNWWADGVRERMPRVRFGQVHVVNNLFSSAGNGQCVRAGFQADLLVEGNVFRDVNLPIDLYNNDFTAVTARNNSFINTTGNQAGSGTAFTPPYGLTVDPVAMVEAQVRAGAGATLGAAGCGTVASPTRTPLVPSRTATPTLSRSPTATATRTATPLAPTLTRTATRSSSPTATASWSPSTTLTATRTASGTATPTPTPVPPSATATLTRSPTATATRTASPSQTRTSSPTATPSWSPSATLSWTPSPLNTLTPTPTVTVTRTSSPTGTASPSQTLSWTPSPLNTLTPTPTVTVTRTSSPTGTASPSQTLSWTPSPLNTLTPTATVTLTATPSSSPTASPSQTQTASPTATPSWSPSATLSGTPSATGTATATVTLSPTETLTASPQDTGTATATRTSSPTPTSSATPSATSTSTRTSSPTATASWSPSVSPTRTATWTATLTATPSSTPTPSPQDTGTVTVTPSRTATPVATAEGPLQILGLQAVPNPNPSQAKVQLNGRADAATVRIWSVNLRLLAEAESGPLAEGWSSLPLPAGFVASASNGTYYLTVSARREGQRVRSKPLKFMVLR